MDIKIKSKRLKNLIEYDWVKMLVGIVVAIVVWSLLFTTLGTRITPGEQFTVILYENVKTLNVNKTSNILKDMKKDGRLSYDVLEYGVNTITSAGQYSASYMLSLRTQTQEGDIVLISDGRAIEVEEGSDEDPKADISRVVNMGVLYDIEVFLDSAKEYCLNNEFITVNGTDNSDYTVNEEVIRDYFLTKRIPSAGNYKKTYRTDAQKEDGAKKEIERIKKVWTDYLNVSEAIETAKAQDNDILWYGEVYFYDENNKVIPEKTIVKPFGIDLYKLNKNFKSKAKLEDLWYTYTGEKTTDEGLVLTVLNYSKEQADLQYESLSFINYLIETYSEY